MTMMKTCPFVPFPEAFNDQEVLKDTKISKQTLDLYERPADTLGTHFLEFPISQRQIILGMTKRMLHLDFFRKRLSIRGTMEGIIFEIRGSMIKSYQVDEKDHLLIRIQFSPSGYQEFWMEDPDEIKKLFDALSEFRDCCTIKHKK